MIDETTPTRKHFSEYPEAAWFFLDDRRVDEDGINDFIAQLDDLDFAEIDPTTPDSDVFVEMVVGASMTLSKYLRLTPWDMASDFIDGFYRELADDHDDIDESIDVLVQDAFAAFLKILDESGSCRWSRGTSDIALITVGDVRAAR